MQDINWTRVRDILIVLICIGIVLWAVIFVLGMFVHAIVLLLLAMAVAFLITPLVNVLQKHLLFPRVIATLILYVFILAALGALCYGIIFSLIQQVNYFSTHLPGYVQNLPSTYSSVQDWLIKQGIPQSSINKTLSTISDQANSFALQVAQNLVSIVLIVTDVIVNVLLVTVLSFYLTLDGKRIRDALVALPPRRFKAHVLLFEEALNRVVGNYIRGQLTLAAIIGILAGGGCFFLGLNQFALIIGVLAFLFETIPMVGPALASIPAILISLLLPNPFPRSYEIAIYFVVVQLIESNILGPRILGHAVGLHPVASILALIVGAQLFGAFGALLATPVLAAIWVVVASLYNSLRGEPVDKLLAKKRSPWIRLRRATTSSPPATEKDGGRERQHRTPQGEEADATVGSSSPPGAPLPHLKGPYTPGMIEHMDVLRPVPERNTESSREDHPEKS